MSGKREKLEVEVVSSGGEEEEMVIEMEGKEHPLLNHLILENVFGYRGVSELKVVRQVSHLWRDCSKKSWRASVKFRIEEVAPTHANFSTIEGKRRRELHENFMRLVEIRKISIPVAFVWNSIMRLVGIRKIASPVAFVWNSILVLELDKITLPNVESLRKVLFGCFPNLEELTLGNIRVKGSDGKILLEQTELTEPQNPQRRLKSLTVWGTCHLAVSWMEVLSNFPSLKMISVDTLLKISEVIFNSIIRIRQENHSKLKLKHILLQDYLFIPPKAVTLLMEGNLPLETLLIKKALQNDEFSTIQNILRAHAGTLKKLTISNSRPLPFPLHEFPELKHLQELEADSVAFLQFTPNLRKVTIRQLDMSELDSPPSPLLNLKYVDIQRSTYPLQCLCKPKPELKMLREWIPNLEILKLCGRELKLH